MRSDIYEQGIVVNRWVVVVLVTLAVIVLVSPGIVGRLAERRVEENLDFAASENDEIVITTESFERGWFTSEGRHRIELRGGVLGGLFKGELVTYDEFPSLLVDTHIDHGLVPLTSMSRDSGSLAPGLARTVSTITLDPGAGELIELPGKIYSDVSLTGETRSRFLLPAGSRRLDGRTVEWQGADVTITTNRASGVVSVEGTIRPWAEVYVGGDKNSDGMSLGNVSIKAQQKMGPYGFAIGSIELAVGPASLDTGFVPTSGFQSLSIHAHNEIDGERLNSAATFSITGIREPGLDGIDIALDVVLSGLDSKSAAKLAQTLKGIWTDIKPQDALANLYPLIEADVQTLLASGLEIRFDQLDISIPGGDVTTDFRFSLPESDAGDDFSWPSILLALNAAANVRLPIELFDMVEAMNPDAAMLVGMGVFKADGDYYEMRAEYSSGLITINGAPLPIPLPGM
jgi:uncharacterized protein YdgA (DUF945 family)